VTDAAGAVNEVGQVPTCYRHPDRETYIRCQRCGRYICPDCMRQAAVGFQCPECVAEGAATVRQPRTVYGGHVAAHSDVVTKTLIGINLAVFVIILLTGGVSSAVLSRLAMIGDVGYIEGIGASGGVADGAVWRLLTSVFVHVEPLHLAFNMIALWIFGPTLESLLGRLRYLLLYLLCGLAGSVAVYLLTPPLAATVGASGAVFGLLGAMLVVSIKRGYDVRGLLGLLAINAVFSLIGAGISWQGHLGGFLAGLVLGAGIAYAPTERRSAVQGAVFAGLLVLCVLLVVVRTIMLA
jgi:membrane associated rhomboid family serine protease